jgi:hypothetical protein
MKDWRVPQSTIGTQRSLLLKHAESENGRGVDTVTHLLPLRMHSEQVGTVQEISEAEMCYLMGDL